MTGRRPIKKEHERAVVRDFLQWLNRRRQTRYVVIREPEPPEAIIRSVRDTCWVEVVDSWWSDEYARDVTSYATPGERHKPVKPGPYLNLDIQFAQRFVEVLAGKLKKESYLRCFNQYGPGYLIVSIQYPWFDKYTVQKMNELWLSGQPWPNQRYFKEVYIAFPSMNERAFHRWKI